jgi:hypothetical protein
LVDEIDNYLGRGYSLMEGQYEQIKYKGKSAELILSLIEQINNGESVNGLGEYNIVFYLSNGRRVYRNYLLSEFSDNSMSIEEILNQLQKLNYDETLSKRILADDEIRDQVTFESISVYLSEANKEYRIPLNQKESMDLLGDLIIDNRLVNTDLSIFTNRLVNDRDFSSGMYLTLHTNLGDVEYHLYDYTETYKYVMNIVNKY